MAGQNSIASGLSTLLEILEREKYLGVETIALSGDGERLLRALPSSLKGGHRGNVTAVNSESESRTASPTKGKEGNLENRSPGFPVPLVS